MASKRKANNDYSDIPSEKPKRRREDTTGEEIIPSDGDNTNTPCNCNCNCGCIANYPLLVAMIRQAVREEFAAAQHQCPRLTPNVCGGVCEEAKQFKLEFSNKLKLEYYTQNKILAERDALVEIVLVDVRSGCVVAEGPMSSAEIEICVVAGDFGSENWRREEFNANIIVRPREGRKALLRGRDTRITLEHGVASVRDIEFTDISRFNNSTGTFRLGARSKEANVREALSQPFVVKDKRGEAIMKHVQPSLDSEIWRLRFIAKGGKFHKQLSHDGIETVRDFMRLHTTNPVSLKEKFGNISRSKWEIIIENARACVIDDNVHYSYHAAERRLRFVFNPIYEVVKVSFDDGQTYRSPETFSPAEKHLVEVAKEEAYRNERDFKARAADVEELGSAQVGQSGGASEGGAPQTRVDDLIPEATPRVQEFEWDDDDDLLARSPSPSLLLDLQRILHSDDAPRKRRWIKIRVALKCLTIFLFFCEQSKQKQKPN